MKRNVYGFIALVLVSGCTTVPRDLGRSEVDSLVAQRGWPTIDAQAPEVAALLVEPLDAEAVAQIALLNSPRLQIEIAELGFGAAEVYAAGRLSNPRFTGAWLDSDEAGAGTARTLELVLPFADLLTLPARSKYATAEFAALKASVADAVIDATVEAQMAYYRLVAETRAQSLRELSGTAAKLAVQLGERFRAAGNLEALELAELNAHAGEASLEVLQGAAQLAQARERLANQLGISSAGGWRIDTTLRRPPQTPRDVSELVELASRRRLDLVAARSRADAMAAQLGFTRWSRWLGDVELGVERETETDGARLDGPVLELELPLFNQHRDEVLRADADLTQAVAELRALGVEIENGVRLAHEGLDNARARIAIYEEQVLPAHTAMVARTQEEVNFMLTGVFDLLEVKQDELLAYEAYLRDLADYWVALLDLARAVGTSMPMAAGDAVNTDFLEAMPEGGGHQDHSQHQDHDQHQDHSQHQDHDQHQDHSQHQDHGQHQDQPQPKDHSGHQNHGGSP